MKERKGENLNLQRVLWLPFALILLGGCTNPPDPPEKIEWVLGEPPDTWEPKVTPVYRVEVIPQAKVMSGDDIAMQIFMKIPGTNSESLRSNIVQAPVSNLNQRRMTVDMGGRLGIQNATCSVWVAGEIRRGGTPSSPKDSPHMDFSFKAAVTQTFINVEYDYQQSYGIFNQQGAGSVGSWVDRAFSVAGKGFSFIGNETNLPDSSLKPVPNDPERHLKTFVAQHRNQRNYPLYLAGVKSLEGSPNTPGQTLPISTRPDSNITVLYMETILSFKSSYPFPTDLQIISTTLIHELGHQLGFIGHPQDIIAGIPQKINHNSPFCVMNASQVVFGDNDNTPDNDVPEIKRSIFQNPFFCGFDVDRLKLVAP